MTAHDPRDHYGAYVRQVDPAYGGALGASDTRQAAHIAIGPHKSRLCQLVLAAYATYGEHGLTTQEAEGVTQLEHSTCSARVNELVAAGPLVDSGARRKTRSGRSAAVYRCRK